MAQADDSSLHEYVDAQFVVNGLEVPAKEKELRDSVEQLDGVKELSILHDKVFVHYDPVLISEKVIAEAIGSAGCQIREIKSDPSSPLIGATSKLDEQRAPEEKAK